MLLIIEKHNKIHTETGFKMFRSTGEARQKSINAICSYFIPYKVRSTYDLSLHLPEIIAKIYNDPKIFNVNDSVLRRIEIFKDAISAYARATDFNVKIPENINWKLFQIEECEHPSILPTQEDDLSKVTHSYDQFLNAEIHNEKMSREITKILDIKEGVCDSIILGAGDTGTTLWLEKYKSQHFKASKFISEGTLPNVLIVASCFGNWKHDYTLAQTQSSLERTTGQMNPGDFLPTEFYENNPQANARHVFQANQVCLGNTQAPIIKMDVLKIEKRENHAGWAKDDYPYRLIARLPSGEEKSIYTRHIEICTGLGAANVNVNASVIKSEDLQKLKQFDAKLGYTPFVDGNEFVLTNSQESRNNKVIVIYGGGGTASAIYRKSFFGTDIRTYNRPYTPGNQKNTVNWVFREFIGTGKMAQTALQMATKRNEVFQGDLVKISQRKDGRLSLEFKLHKMIDGSTSKELICDQLVYSIGQDDVQAKQLCHEVSDDLKIHSDDSGMLLYISTPDNNIKFYGSAAISFRKAEVMKQTTSWLNAQNIGGDVGPGSMPPTRAQVKRYLELQHGMKPESINANMDTTCLIGEYLRDAHVEKPIVDAFLADLLLARKDDTYGCSRNKLEQLLKKYGLDKIFNIYGHSHLVIKGQRSFERARSLPNLSVKDNQKLSMPQEVRDDTQRHLPEVYLRFLPPLSLFTRQAEALEQARKNGRIITPRVIKIRRGR